MKTGQQGLALVNILATIPSIFLPIAAAYIVSTFGGISVKGIRPLYWAMFIGEISLFICSFRALKEGSKTVEVVS